MNSPEYHIFVCSSSRINGQQRGFCVNKDSIEIIQNFMMEIQDRDLSSKVIITNTGCFGICDKGPIVLIYPEGVWYGNVTPDNVEEIVSSHIEKGEVVERLQI